jgi:type IV secretory pathway VirD2 relaxase
MTSLSFDRLLKSSQLAAPSMARADTFIADRSIGMLRPDRERLDGKVKKSRGGASGGGALTKALSKRLKTKPPRSSKAGRKRVSVGGADFDRRQRAIVKIHYFNHTRGGAAGLKAHAQYIAREAASRDDPPTALEPEAGDTHGQTRAHANYLDRGGQNPFYDADSDGVDGAARIEAWAKSDRRHFRLILSAEEGARLKDQPSYTRQVMARAGVALGTTLSWVAVDHHDTDNPHTHLIMRGRRANGQDLVLPKDFIKHGFRSIARDVATEWLGERTREDERLALDRETRRHAPTRLDRMIEAQLGDTGRVRGAELRAPNGDHALAQAMKLRVRELERIGLAQSLGRELFQLAPDWRERLQAMELHANIRKRIVQERTQRDIARQQQLARQIRKGLIER